MRSIGVAIACAGVLLESNDLPPTRCPSELSFSGTRRSQTIKT